MGKFMRKCKGIGEIAVMEVAEVGVRTRAKVLAMAAASRVVEKRRKLVSSTEFQFGPSCSHRRTEKMKKKISPGNSIEIRFSDEVPAAESRCSSNGSSELLNENENEMSSRSAPDLKREEELSLVERRKRRETTPSSDLRTESGDLDSTARLQMENSEHRSTVEKMPTQAEIEDFFSAAEKDQKKRFAEKYSYDIEKDVPLEGGRFEWVRLKQQ